MTALSRQVDGAHYKNLVIQPIEFSMANGLDACAHSTLKYIVRHPEKGGRSDLEKALHFVELREQLTPGKTPVCTGVWPISMSEFCGANDLPAPESEVLFALCTWLSIPIRLNLHVLKARLQDLIELRYP